MTTTDALVVLVALLMLALANEMRRSERLLELAGRLEDENDRLRADLEATSLSDEEFERLCDEASSVATFPARWADGSGAS